MIPTSKTSETETICSLQLNNELVSGVPSYLTVKEVAEILRVSPDSVYRLLDKRDIPFYQLGGSRRISVDDLQKYLDACYVQARK